jgi:hypothetical protein
VLEYLVLLAFLAVLPLKNVVVALLVRTALSSGYSVLVAIFGLAIAPIISGFAIFSSDIIITNQLGFLGLRVALICSVASSFLPVAY